jgi:hypothetical protein
MSTSLRPARLLSRPSSFTSHCTRLRLRSANGSRTVFTRTSPRQAAVASSTSPTTPQTAQKTSTPPPSKPKGPLAELGDEPIKLQEDDPSGIDWSSSFSGLSVQPFSKEAADVLMAPINKEDVEIKPDGIIYLPEIKYRRILNRAFGPGAWGLAPRGETIVTEKAVTREYALLVLGR